MTRIGIIGLGRAARQIHIPAYAAIPGTQIVGGYDAGQPQGTFDFPRFDSLEALLSGARPDIVTIAAPTAMHFPLARSLLERRIHVFCEKPFTDTVEQAAELVRLGRTHGARIAVNNEYRFMACHRAARALVGSPQFGELVFVHMTQAFRASAESEGGWRAEDRERTCKEFGTHVFDLCRYFFAAEPLRLRARMPRRGLTGGADMLNLIDVEFPEDRWAHITLDRLTRGRHRYLDIRLDGTRGTIETELGGNVSISGGIHAATRRPYLDWDLSLGGRAFLYQGESKRKLASDPLNLFASATRALFADFIDAIRADRDAACSGHDNIRTLALMRAAYESARDDRDVDLEFLRALP
jgi:predicted dehydrogenase